MIRQFFRTKNMKSGEKTGQPVNSIKSSGRWLFLAIFFFLVFFLFSAAALLVKVPAGVIARGVTVGWWDVGGLSPLQAERFIKNQTDSLEKDGLLLRHKNYEVRLPPVIYSPVNPELS